MHGRSPGSRHFQSRGGNIMPRPQYRPDDVARAQGEILRDRYGRLKSPAKEQAVETGQSVRACRNQQAGLNCMQLTEFFNACQIIPELKEWGMRMMGCESETDPEFVHAMTMAFNALAKRR